LDERHLRLERTPLSSTNDYKYDNVVLDSQNITKIVGVLDWNGTDRDPLSDLGTALGTGLIRKDPRAQKIRWGPTNFPGQSHARPNWFSATVSKPPVMYQNGFLSGVCAIQNRSDRPAIIIATTRPTQRISAFASMPELIKTFSLASLRTAESGAI